MESSMQKFNLNIIINSFGIFLDMYYFVKFQDP